jgi:predicted nucleic acid-binding Zn ribbon protein
MPTYTYLCRRCNTECDLDVYYNDAELSLGELRCKNPMRTGDQAFFEPCLGFMRRVWNIGGISFKGSGFYRNDSRPKPKPEKPATKPAKEKP